MNWKIWQWPAEIRRQQQRIEYLQGVVRENQELPYVRIEADCLKQENALLRQILDLRRASPVAREVAAQLGEQLVVVTEATPWWRHLHGLLQLEIDQAVNDALQPDLTNDTANLRRGRAAMLKDFRGLLQDIYLQAQTRKRESA